MRALLVLCAVEIRSCKFALRISRKFAGHSRRVKKRCEFRQISPLLNDSKSLAKIFAVSEPKNYIFRQSRDFIRAQISAN